MLCPHLLGRLRQVTRRPLPHVVVKEGGAVAVRSPQDREEALVHRGVADALVAVVDVAGLGRVEAGQALEELKASGDQGEDVAMLIAFIEKSERGVIK